MGPQVRCIVLAFLIIYGGEARGQNFEELVSRDHLKQKRNVMGKVLVDKNTHIQRPQECFIHVLRRVGLDRMIYLADISQEGNNFDGWTTRCNNGSYSLLIYVNGIRQGMRFSIRVGNVMRDISDRMENLERSACGFLILDSDDLPSEQRKRCLNTLLIWNSTSPVTVNMAYMIAKQ